jgi:hypothetical protein
MARWQLNEQDHDLMMDAEISGLWNLEEGIF